MQTKARYTNPQNYAQGDPRRNEVQVYSSQVRSRCSLCKRSHYTSECEQLLKAKPEERRKIIEQAGLCTNCLRDNRKIDACQAGTCRKCKGRHNTLLHLDEESATVKCGHLKLDRVPLPTILLTAVVSLLDRDGNPHKCRVLLDSGAEANFLKIEFANKLRLPKQTVDIPIAGINETGTNVNKIIVTTMLTSPAHQVLSEELIIPGNIQLADPDFAKPSEIDAIIGIEIFCSLWRAGQIVQLNETLAVQNKRLGWIVVTNGDMHVPQTVKCHTAMVKLNNQLEKFWRVELTPENSIKSHEEECCEEHYKVNNWRNDSERSLARIPEIRKEYQEFLTEYENLGHMEKLNSSSRNDGYYLPHHAVIKQLSLNTKLRVVFDASAKSDNGLSFNDVLMVGPTIQEDLFAILVRFRSHLFALTADIAKMYRQIIMDPRDRKFQNILWRRHENEPIKTYRLNTVIYGTASASFLATRTLHQLASDESERFPRASVILKEDFYWASKNTEILRGLNNTSNNKLVSLDIANTIKTLGVNWNAVEDTISYTVKRSTCPCKISNRNILSEIAQIFDPLGLLGPVIVNAKVIMQLLRNPTQARSAASSLQGAFVLLARVLPPFLLVQSYASTATLSSFSVIGPRVASSFSIKARAFTLQHDSTTRPASDHFEENYTPALLLHQRNKGTREEGHVVRIIFRFGSTSSAIAADRQASDTSATTFLGSYSSRILTTRSDPKSQKRDQNIKKKIKNYKF
ncbi:uncharacterized protein LOC122521768 [Polistes fuscatus]|uniref:uncharacterized protein LOC122521768 n=1 Tax=Polistes fuscatus TaxID=30207 RepID=UPI001CAA1A4F|nr:uncharacterized protein LOC122521768 [Polistes fuscatus]